MKILLVNPPARRHNLLRTPLPRWIEEEKGAVPPLGLLSLAAVLRKSGRHRAIVLDAEAEQMSYPRLARTVRESAPDAIGIQAMTFTLIDVVETARQAKEAQPGAHVIVGGPHTHIFPEETIRLPGIDFLVVGEGEESLPSLLDALEDGAEPAGIPGVVYRRGDEVIDSGPAPFIEDLDKLPFPVRSPPIPADRYRGMLSGGAAVTTMVTSRGCPYQCIFCDRPHMGKRFRARSPSNVAEEMAECVSTGAEEILFYDDTFTLDRGRVEGICEEIGRRSLSIAWDMRARADGVDRPMLERLQAAGCRRVHLGVEAGTQRVLDVLRKGITLEQARCAVSDARRAGLSCLVYFMIGSPSETHDEVEQTIRFARDLGADYAHFALTLPYPGTALYSLGLEMGLYNEDHWRAFAKAPRPSFSPRFWDENMEAGELEALLRRAYRSFYLRPGMIARSALRTRSLRALFNQARAAVNILLR